MGLIAQNAALAATQPQVAPPPATAMPAVMGPPPPDQPSVGGFLGNIVGGLENFGQGIGKLMGSGIHDAIHLATAGQFDKAGGFQLDEVAKQMPAAIWKDEFTRWSPLFKGDFGQFAHQLYTQPVSFGLDALTVASAGATAEGLLGKTALKAADAAGVGASAGDAASLVGKTADIASQLTELAGVVPKTAKAAALRTTLDELATAGVDTGLAGTLRKLLPSTKYVREGDTLKLAAETYNPLTRFVKESTFGRATTTSLSKLQDTLKAEIAGTPMEAVNTPTGQLQIQRGALYGDAAAKNLTRIETASMGAFRASRAGAGIAKFTSGEFFRQRLAAVKADAEDWTRTMKASTPEEVNGASSLAVGGDMQVIGLPYDELIKQRAVKNLGSELRPIDLVPDAPKVLRTAEDINSASVAKLQGQPILTIAETQLANLKALKEQLISTQAVNDAVHSGPWTANELDAIAHMEHDIVNGLDIQAADVLPAGSQGVGVRPWNQVIERQRLRDIARMSPGWSTLDPSTMPSQILAESWRTVQYAHGAELILGPAKAAKAETPGQLALMDYGAPAGVGDGLSRTVTGPSWQQFHEAFRSADRQSPIYYPFIEADHLSSANWFRRTGYQGAVQLAEDKSARFNTGQLYRSGDYITDPIEAYSRHAALGVKEWGTARTINAYLERGGRPITAADQVAHGEVMMSPMLVNIRASATNAFRHISESLQLKGMSLSDASLAAVDRVAEANRYALDEALKNGTIKMYAVPEAMAKHMNDAAKWGRIVNKTAKLYVDGPMNVWRSLVLAGSPRWVVNNILGNVIFTAMEGGSTARAFAILEQQAVKAIDEKWGVKLHGTGMLDAIDAAMQKAGLYEQVAGSTGTAYAASKTHLAPGAEESAIGKMTRSSREAQFVPWESKTGFQKALAPPQKFSEVMRGANSQIESAFRRNSFLTEFDKAKGISTVQRVMRRYTMSGDGIQRLLKEGLTQGESTAVLNGVNHFFGDFANLNPLERNIIRPYIMPFWGFYKFQTKLFLSYPFEYPAKAQILAGLASVENAIGATYGPRPDWLLGATPIGPPGTSSFISGGGPNPFNGLFQSPIGQLSPLLKAPIEHFTGRSLFTGQPFTDKNTITPFGSDTQYHISRDAQGNVTGVTPLAGKVTPGLLESLLSQVPQYQSLKRIVAGGTTYDTSSIFSGGGGVVIDPKTGLPKYPSSVLHELGKYLGIPITNYDLAAFQTYLAAEQKSALTAANKRAAAEQGAPLP